MNKKFYDKNNFVVGILIGETTATEKITDNEDAVRVADLLNSMPVVKGSNTHLIELNANGEFINYGYGYTKIPESELSDEALKEMFAEEIMNSVVVSTKPVAKQGYELKPVLNGTVISWEFVKINEESDDRDGSYLHPLFYSSGMMVFKDKFYTDGEDIWEAIKDGVPSSFEDKEYFDIIG